MFDTRLNKLAWDSWMLAVDASAVIWLRMGRFVLFDADIPGEFNRMVGEKVEASFVLFLRALTGQLGTNQLDVARASVTHYRRKVSANRRRLTRPR